VIVPRPRSERNQQPNSRSVWPSRRLLLGVVALFALGLTCAWVAASPDTAVAATVAVDQCNFDETGAAREVRCDVAVVNNLDVATGITSSTVTTTVCAGPPGEAECVTTPGASTVDIVGSVNQCNNSVNAGGSIVVCNVTIENNITGSGSATPATVNQCIGSGQGGGDEPTTVCDPISSASGADIIQCNTAGNGGGASERVQCTVPTSTVSALWPVTIVQCNDSANGGGDLVTCTAQITTNFLAPPTTTTVAATTTVDAATTTVDAATTTVDAATTTLPAATSTTVPVGVTLPATTIPFLPSTGSTSGGLLLAALATALGAVTLVVARRRTG
jgi:LPXTG-motif cell wall-anchored protein